MRYRLNLILFGSLIWVATGCCCCYDQCCNYGGYGYTPTAYNYGGGYNTVATTGNAKTQATGNSSYVASNQSNYNATTGAVNNYAPVNGTYTAANNQTIMPQQQSSTSGNLCPCETSDFSSTIMQDVNGTPMPMEGMVYDASDMYMPMMTAPPTTAAELKTETTKPGELIPVPQPEIGIPTSTDGRPLVPPAPAPLDK
ncbi:hypothetical protein CA54_52050 [Symmachiella macrocystis]|uniref:Uncharacterized protein n=1 Tax=Symmachiella macrocystis TaxID=2527985 RepID=A0A5C6B6B0_9PLAN|nr:hypothetical protein [Symmachiella macrocystis]TWU06806.1 hypothetical protein CA54_52050 [Symmachiella macrocystis]